MRRSIDWLLVILWMLVIFIASSQPSFALVTDGWSDFIVKKLAHFTEYAILGYLTIRACQRSSILITRKVIIIVILGCALYALSDEIHQSFVPGRQPHLRDVAIDIIGACFGVHLFTRRKKTTG